MNHGPLSYYRLARVFPRTFTRVHYFKNKITTTLNVSPSNQYVDASVVANSNVSSSLESSLIKNASINDLSATSDSLTSNLIKDVDVTKSVNTQDSINSSYIAFVDSNIYSLVDSNLTSNLIKDVDVTKSVNTQDSINSSYIAFVDSNNSVSSSFVINSLLIQQVLIDENINVNYSLQVYSVQSSYINDATVSTSTLDCHLLKTALIINDIFNDTSITAVCIANGAITSNVISTDLIYYNLIKSVVFEENSFVSYNLESSVLFSGVSSATSNLTSFLNSFAIKYAQTTINLNTSYQIYIEGAQTLAFVIIHSSISSSINIETIKTVQTQSSDIIASSLDGSIIKDMSINNTLTANINSNANSILNAVINQTSNLVDYIQSAAVFLASSNILQVMSGIINIFEDSPNTPEEERDISRDYYSREQNINLGVNFGVPLRSNKFVILKFIFGKHIYSDIKYNKDINVKVNSIYQRTEKKKKIKANLLEISTAQNNLICRNIEKKPFVYRIKDGKVAIIQK